MTGSDLGRAMAGMVGSLVMAAFVIGVVIGAVLYIGVPWLWALMQAHVAFR